MYATLLVDHEHISQLLILLFKLLYEIGVHIQYKIHSKRSSSKVVIILHLHCSDSELYIFNCFPQKLKNYNSLVNTLDVLTLTWFFFCFTIIALYCAKLTNNINEDL